jgi:hypothetical protein
MSINSHYEIQICINHLLINTSINSHYEIQICTNHLLINTQQFHIWRGLMWQKQV